MEIESAVFPFHERMLPFVRHFNQAQDTYHICQAIAWSGMGLNGQDVAYICRHPSIGIPVVLPTESETFLNWQVLFVDYDELEKAHSIFDAFAFFEKLLSDEKKIIVTTRKSNLNLSNEWSRLSNKYPNQVMFFSEQHIIEGISLPGDGGYKLLPIPVLMVGGLITQEDCLEVILSLRESLIKQGKVISCLTESNMGLLMGMHSYTHIFDKEAGLSEEDKALELNRLAQIIIQAERPSLLIIEAPDPMLKYNNMAPNGFGLQSYLSCQALKPDMLVCSVPADMAMVENLLNLFSEDFKIRYGTPITAVHISNVVVDSFDVAQLHTITRVHIDFRQAGFLYEQKGKSQTFPVFDVVSEGADKLTQLLFQEETLWQ